MQSMYDSSRYDITSRSPEAADAARLLALVRGHWQIENGLHDVKDVMRGEDRNLIHTGHGPSVMAILRDTVVHVLHRAGWRTIAERWRYDGGHPREVLALLGFPGTENHKPRDSLRQRAAGERAHF